jgi:hypothetical protein
MTFFPIPNDVRNTWPQGARDFDFLEGEWLIQHRRLKDRLVGSDDWLEFETPFFMAPILGGLGNIDQCRTAGPPFFEGVSLRLFDTVDGLWRIYWMDSGGARLFPPVVGSFAGARGTFRGEDTQDSRSVHVVFHWDKSDPDRPVWQQAFSADKGATWETNWFMHFRRPTAPPLGPEPAAP